MFQAPGKSRHALLLCSVLASPGAWADALAERDGPLTGLYGFPDAREGARLLAPGQQALSFSALVSNHAVRDDAEGEALLLDGETARLTLGWRRALLPRFELGVELPWVMHSSGGLDGAIARWHDLFGLPQGIRDDVPADRLLFRYVGQDGAALVLDENVAALGDVRLTGAWQLAAGPGSAHALRVGLKLPTGDREKLTGSGAADLSLGLAGAYLGPWGRSAARAYWQASATLLGRPDALPLKRKPVVGQLLGGIGWQLSPRIVLAAQSRFRSRVYDSAASPLGDFAMSLTLGANIRIGRSLRLALGVTEDLRVDSLPDVTFGLALAWIDGPAPAL